MLSRRFLVYGTMLSEMIPQLLPWEKQLQKDSWKRQAHKSYAVFASL